MVSYSIKRKKSLILMALCLFVPAATLPMALPLPGQPEVPAVPAPVANLVQPKASWFSFNQLAFDGIIHTAFSRLVLEKEWAAIPGDVAHSLTSGTLRQAIVMALALDYPQWVKNHTIPYWVIWFIATSIGSELCGGAVSAVTARIKPKLLPLIAACKAKISNTQQEKHPSQDDAPTPAVIA